MKKSVLLSILFHAILIIGVYAWRSEPKKWNAARTFYQVELVSMAQAMEKAPIKQVAPLSVPKAETPSINVAKQPKKETTPSRKEQKPEAPSKQVSESKVVDQSGTGSSKLTVDIKDFPFSYYLNLLQYRVQENWQPPFQTAEPDEKIIAVVRFRVLRQGRIVDVVLEQSSNRYLYDQAAQRAVYLAAPLPPLPDEFSGEYLTVYIEFEGLW